MSCTKIRKFKFLSSIKGEPCKVAYKMESVKRKYDKLIKTKCGFCMFRNGRV